MVTAWSNCSRTAVESKCNQSCNYGLTRSHAHDAINNVQAQQTSCPVQKPCIGFRSNFRQAINRRRTLTDRKHSRGVRYTCDENDEARWRSFSCFNVSRLPFGTSRSRPILKSMDVITKMTVDRAHCSDRGKQPPTRELCLYIAKSLHLWKNSSFNFAAGVRKFIKFIQP